MSAFVRHNSLHSLSLNSYENFMAEPSKFGATRIGLARLIEISVNWSIDNGKTIIDEHNETIDYLLLLF